MMLFNSLMIILLAFFILLNALADIDESRKKEAIGSLQGAFGVLMGGNEAEQQASTMNRSESLTEDQEIIQSLLRDLRIVIRDKKLGDPQDVGLESGGLYPRLRLASHLLYRPGGIEITPKAFPILDLLAKAGARMNANIEVEGHTGPREGRPAVGVKTGWEISAHRAVNVQRYFIEVTRISPEKVEALGVGEFRATRPEDQIFVVFRDETKEDAGKKVR
jgi:chemotaxis protein MotB